MIKGTLLTQWKGFLPQRAWVMARRPDSNRTPEAAEEITPSPLPPSSPGSGEESFTPELALLTDSASSPEKSPTELLHHLQTELQNCTNCKLSQTRTHLVFGEGDPHARLVFLGEAPGEEEDLHGRPFVGKSGELLDRMITAMGLSREEVYILNLVKCHLPGNQALELDEITACSSHLSRHLKCLNPQVIVTLGKGATQALLQTEEKITQLRGRFHSHDGVKVMPTYHPAYLLRNPASKKETWWDLQEVVKELGLTLPERKQNDPRS